MKTIQMAFGALSLLLCSSAFAAPPITDAPVALRTTSSRIGAHPKLNASPAGQVDVVYYDFVTSSDFRWNLSAGEYTQISDSNSQSKSGHADDGFVAAAADGGLFRLYDLSSGSHEYLWPYPSEYPRISDGQVVWWRHGQGLYRYDIRERESYSYSFEDPIWFAYRDGWVGAVRSGRTWVEFSNLLSGDEYRGYLPRGISGFEISRGKAFCLTSSSRLIVETIGVPGRPRLRMTFLPTAGMRLVRVSVEAGGIWWRISPADATGRRTEAFGSLIWRMKPFTMWPRWA